MVDVLLNQTDSNFQTLIDGTLTGSTTSLEYGVKSNCNKRLHHSTEPEPHHWKQFSGILRTYLL